MKKKNSMSDWERKREAEKAAQLAYNKELDSIIERVQKLSTDVLTGRFKDAKAAGDEKVRTKLISAGYALQSARSLYR